LAVLQSTLVIYTRIYNTTTEHGDVRERKALLQPVTMADRSLDAATDAETGTLAFASTSPNKSLNGTPLEPHMPPIPSSVTYDIGDCKIAESIVSAVIEAAPDGACEDTRVPASTNGLIVPTFAAIGPRMLVNIGGGAKVGSDGTGCRCCSAGVMSSSEFTAIASKIASAEL
jgi:hypothetical protein